MTKSLLFVVNELEFFLSHRLEIALAAQNAGYEVHVVASAVGMNNVMPSNIIFYNLNFHRSSLNPFLDIHTFLKLLFLILKIRPTIVHVVTLKPILFVGIISLIVPLRGLVVAFAGLGFIGRSKKIFNLIKPLFKRFLNQPNVKIIFQNSHDVDVCSRLFSLQASALILIPGSGVDLDNFAYSPEPISKPVKVVMASRLLFNKGVVQFVEASEKLSQKGIFADFLLIGKPDIGNDNSVPISQLQLWHKKKVIKYLGFQSDIRKFYSESNIVVLPSFYGEGVPKSLIEACAIGRAIVTTNMPGCRDAVINGKSGLLVKPKDSFDLANAIEFLILRPHLRSEFGKEGRKLAECKFSLQNVINVHLDIYASLSEVK